MPCVADVPLYQQYEPPADIEEPHDRREREGPRPYYIRESHVEISREHIIWWNHLTHAVILSQRAANDHDFDILLQHLRRGEIPQESWQHLKKRDISKVSKNKLLQLKGSPYLVTGHQARQTIKILNMWKRKVLKLNRWTKLTEQMSRKVHLRICFTNCHGTKRQIFRRH